MPRNTLNYIGLYPFIELLFSNPTRANDNSGISDFVLFIEHSGMEWIYPTVGRETTTTRILAIWHESFSQYLKGGLRLACLDVNQAANPLPSGLNSTGYGLGFDLHTGLRLKTDATGSMGSGITGVRQGGELVFRRHF